MLSNKQNRILSQILPFGLIPALFGLVQVIMEKGVLGSHPIYPSTGNPYDPNIYISVLTSLFIGLLIGLFEVFYVNKWFQNRKFYEKILFKFIVYILAIIVATLIIIVLSHSIAQGLNPTDDRVIDYLFSFFSNFAFWSIICYYSLAIIISLFYKEVADNMGSGASLNFFTGKYHQPIAESRVFMFLDMKSSTAHAEKLGHIKYFEMLKEYYADLSEPILTYGGEIYQYVGDEIVVTWKLKDDFASNVLNCFFAMKETLNREHQKFLTHYKIAPTFKAGIHYGRVTTGEIGSIKKDIVFTGDTLNTTARIQNLCNTFEVDLIVSELFKNAMETNGKYIIIPMGQVELRGRNKKMNLFNITKKESEEL